jgi:hypothetical protein
MTCVAPARTSGRVHVGQRAEHRDAADPRIALHRIVVEQAEHDPALVVDRREQPLGGFARPITSALDALGIAAGDARAGMLVEHPVCDRGPCKRPSTRRTDGVRARRAALGSTALRRPSLHTADLPPGRPT